jgi:hypothetical protein
MTDVAYLCHNCGTVHEVETIRESLILDLRTAASYELSGHPGILGPRTRFLRWRMTKGLARALWPAHARRPRLTRGRRLVHDRPRPDLIAPSIAEPQQVAATRPGNPALASTRPTGPCSPYERPSR